MATATKAASKVIIGEPLRIVGNPPKDGGPRPDERRENPAHPVVGTSWRVVLIVGPAPGGPPVPFVLERPASHMLGSGATVLDDCVGPWVRIRFDHIAPTWAEAISAAIREVESVGLRVLRVDNDDWVTLGDVALKVGRSREVVRQWATGHTGPGGFPLPANLRRYTTFYSWAEVLWWLREQRKFDIPGEEPTLVAANLAVQLRALLPRVPRPGAILDLLRESGPVNGVA